MTHVQSLESRTLMSVTASTLNADYAAVLADRGAITSAINALSTTLTAGIRTINTDLKGTPRVQAAANHRLVVQLQHDDSLLISALRHDASILTSKGDGKGATAKAAGILYLRKATSARLTKVTSTAAVLDGSVSAALAVLTSDTHLSTVDAALAAIVTANPTNSKLATDVASTTANASVAPVDTAAQTFAGAASTLATDLDSSVGALTTYDSSGDYSASANPNAVWSYGDSPSLTGAVTLYTGAGVLPYGNGFDVWYDPTFGLHAPFIYKNNGGNYQDSNIAIPAGALIVHGGTPTGNNGFSNVVFTAPAAGEYNLSTTFSGVQIGGELASVNVLDNGASLFSSSVIYGQSQSYAKTLNLAAGETIDFAIGYVNQNPVDGDSVQLQATFTTVSEPAPLAAVRG